MALFLKENKSFEMAGDDDSESNKENQRKKERQNLMLADISVMISEYKKK